MAFPIPKGNDEALDHGVVGGAGILRLGEEDGGEAQVLRWEGGGEGDESGGLVGCVCLDYLGEDLPESAHAFAVP